MAQERKRTVPVRKTKDGEPGAAAAAKKAPVSARKTAGKAETTAAKAKATTPKTAKAAKPATAAKKAAAPAKRTTASATAPKRRARTLQAVPEPTREEIAFHAYLLWEQGVPGGETEHWLRAEAELRAA